MYPFPLPTFSHIIDSRKRREEKRRESLFSFFSSSLLVRSRVRACSTIVSVSKDKPLPPKQLKASQILAQIDEESEANDKFMTMIHTTRKTAGNHSIPPDIIVFLLMLREWIKP